MRELGCGAGVTVGLFDGVDSTAMFCFFYNLPKLGNANCTNSRRHSHIDPYEGSYAVFSECLVTLAGHF